MALNLKRKRLENILAICVVTVFMGQVYISPFSQWFRFSLAVLILSLLLIYFKDVSVMAVSSSIAILMFLFRSFIHFIGNNDITFFKTLFHYVPVAMFYLIYGLLFKILNIRNKLDRPIVFILYLWICDSVGNMSEAILRSFWIDVDFDRVILLIILVGLLRSLITCFIYQIILYYKNSFEREQKENKFRELLLFTARLKTELFFLKKSMVDIEDMMEKSYELYEELEEPRLQDKALNISKNIHEIKKDYLRVVLGMEKTLSEENENLHMSIKDIFKIIKDNTYKLIDLGNKNISLEFSIKHNFKTSDFYPLISILNNLIINAIDAIESEGSIVVEESMSGKNYIFRITDNGTGIEEDDIDLIFEPGFTTKFDKTTGKMSTGIGLSHVKHIVESHYNGKIYLKDVEENTTLFEVKIPAPEIERR
ncbi:sensor histidine kinase [Wukongibacter sp. M2B1]|uniref:sensor histidine kinase n=1 Tax=Wukongibacter sp. M2B1 TaxID=3088895 RepID=UPI003D78BFC1